MPNDSTPRSFAALISMPPGNFAPTVASGAFRPARAFGAPQTICTGSPVPTETWQTCRRSASGCLAQERISATTTPSSAAPMFSTPSTSRPMAVRLAASSSRVALTVTCSRSQLSGNFIKGREWRIGNWKSRYRPGKESGTRNDSRLPISYSQPSGELLQEPRIVLEETAQVVDAVTQHRKALHAEAESEAGVAFRINAAVAQHVR